MPETARLPGEHHPISDSIRRRLGLTDKRPYSPKPGNTDRAKRLYGH